MKSKIYAISFSSKADAAIIPFDAAYAMVPSLPVESHDLYVVQGAGHCSIVPTTAALAAEPIKAFLRQPQGHRSAPSLAQSTALKRYASPDSRERAGLIGLATAATLDIWSMVDHWWQWGAECENKLTARVDDVVVSTSLVVFLHGLGAGPRQGVHFLKRLSGEPDATFYFPQLFNYGNAPKELLVPPIAEWIREYHLKFPTNPIVLVGTSNGCRVGDAVLDELQRGDDADASILTLRIASAAAGTQLMDLADRWGLASHLHEGVKKDFTYQFDAVSSQARETGDRKTAARGLFAYVPMVGRTFIPQVLSPQVIWRATVGFVAPNFRRRHPHVSR